MPRPLLVGVALLAFLPLAQAAPAQVHLSQPDESVVVQWALPGDTRAWPAGRVEFGVTSAYGANVAGELVGHVDAAPYFGFSSSGIQRDLEEAAATLYRARLPAMTPATTFHYRVVDGTGAASGDFLARTLPGPSDALRFAAYADQGTLEDGTLSPPGSQPREVVNETLLRDPHLVLVAGDTSYAEEAGLRWWNDWFDIIEPIAATRPFFVAVGNHDRDFLTGYDQWEKRFSFARDERNYGFDAGPVHFLVVNSQEACLEGTTTQAVQRVNPNCNVATHAGAALENTEITDFMREDLADARARGVPWIVVVFHHPPYSRGGYNETNSGNAYMYWLREHWVPIFEEHGVDLVVNGHDHSYQRSWPLLAGEATVASGSRYHERDGIVYVVAGGGGRPVHQPEADWWMAAGAKAHHVVLVDATTDRLRVEVRDTADALLDAFEVGKTPIGQQALPAALALAAVAGLGARAMRRREG